jgi:predicted RNA-binding protein YlqC (UPF0109 family)
MAAESQIAEVCLVFSLLVRAMVKKPDAVTVIAVALLPNSYILRVTVAETDVGSLIGKAGRSARSLRIILQAIAHRQGEVYSLDINGARIEPS